MVEQEDQMLRKLRAKAYEQGYRVGFRGDRLNLADWEEEFWPQFRQGFATGKAAREKSN